MRDISLTRRWVFKNKDYDITHGKIFLAPVLFSDNMNHIAKKIGISFVRAQSTQPYKFCVYGELSKLPEGRLDTPTTAAEYMGAPLKITGTVWGSAHGAASDVHFLKKLFWRYAQNMGK